MSAIWRLCDPSTRMLASKRNKDMVLLEVVETG
jgi:hypothetical protein